MPRRTFFIDLDGVVLQKYKTGGSQHWTFKVLPHGRDNLQALAHEGAFIVLCTGRKENQRGTLEGCLMREDVPYDLLIMGLGSGERVVVNDGLLPRARAICVEANKPWAIG